MRVEKMVRNFGNFLVYCIYRKFLSKNGFKFEISLWGNKIRFSKKKILKNEYNRNNLREIEIEVERENY